MSLEQYAKKRTFDRTPEPPPDQAAGSGQAFCVQRHLARRLHYDLRLQLGGTLKSWAVPQGPTLDPAVKRLAVLVEDHPLEYGRFEGNIPKGNYGAGSVMLWDFGSFEVLEGMSAEAQMERGDFKFALHGQKLSGTYALVRLKNSAKGNEWLLLKKKDAAAVPGWDVEQHAWSVLSGRTQEEIAADLPWRSQPPPEPASTPAVVPMLATLTGDPPEGKDWVYEVKWDGVRAICQVAGGQARFFGRKGTEITRQYPELSVVSRSVAAGSAVLDGEVAAVDEHGRPSFGRLQPRIMAADANAIAQMARSRPVVYFVFDLLSLNGRDLRGEPLSKRRELLEKAVVPSGRLVLSEWFRSDPKHLLEAAREQGLEGIVAKRLSSRYEGARSREWLKLKATREQEFVIAGFTQGERDHFGALLLGVFDNGELTFAGSVGTGFDQKLMKAIRERLDALRTAQSPFRISPSLPQPIEWVDPRLVCRVRYLEWTGEGRLRAPVFVGMRDDMDPRECTRTEPSAETRPPLLPAGKDQAQVDVEGRSFLVRNLNKVFYPDDGVTKRDVLEYYNAVADLLLPHLRDRPLSLRRYPDGITKEGFFQKNASELPDWLRRETILAEDGRQRVQVIGGSRADLLYLANLGCIDQNPWMSRAGSLDHPDFLLIDLDPHECAYDRIVEAALFLRAKLTRIGFEGFPKTTGGDGMHIYVPLDPVYSYEQARSFAEVLARLAASERPDLFTLPRTVGRRERGKVYFDYLQISRGKTISAPYVLRAYPGAPVATPLSWAEVRPGLHPSQFNIRGAMARFDRVGDLFAPVLTLRQRLEEGLERLGSLLH